MTPTHTLTLFSSGAQFGLPEASPYVTKTEVQLKMAGLSYRKEPARPDRSPKGQLPFIDDEGEVVADSTFIRAHLEHKYGFDLDAGLDARQRAEAWAIERMLENHLGWTSTWARFLLPENFERGPARWFDQAPEHVREQLRDDMRARVVANCKSHGIGRHAPAEIVELADRSLGALSVLLGDKPYLMGNEPSGVDAIAFALLAGLLTPFFDSPLRPRVQAYGNLPAYVDRMMARYYPEHPWQSQG